jgi:hypothetical protein
LFSRSHGSCGGSYCCDSCGDDCGCESHDCGCGCESHDCGCGGDANGEVKEIKSEEAAPEAPAEA